MKKLPDIPLLNMIELEKTALYCLRHNQPLPTIRPIPNRDHWTPSQLQVLEDNRAKAISLLEILQKEHDQIKALQEKPGEN